MANKHLLALTAFSGISGFLFGYDTGNISGALPYIEDELLSAYKDDLHKLHLIEGFIVSGAVLGAAIGSSLGGIFSDKYGRKTALKFADVLFILGAILMAISQSALLLILGRVLVGFGIGIASVTAPVYIAETSPSSMRASMVTFNSFMITFGQLIAYFASYLFTFTDGTWRWMLGIAALPAIIQAVGLSYLPESPRWLLSKGQDSEAHRILALLAHPVDQKEEYRIQAENEQGQRKKSFLELLSSKSLQKELNLGIGLQIWQQLCGINTVMYYTPTMLRLAGVTNNRLALLVAMGPAFVNALGSIVGMYLVDYVGRRKLLLGSLIGITLSLALLGGSFKLSEDHSAIVTKDLCTTSKSLKSCAACVQNGCRYCPSTLGSSILEGTCIEASDRCGSSQYEARDSCPNPYFVPIIISVVLYLAAFSPGMGTVPWCVNAEIFPIEVRGLANGASATANWISNALVSQLFLSLADYLGASGVFWLLAGISVLALLWVYKLLPETKGLSFEAIQALFRTASVENNIEADESETSTLQPYY